MLNLALSVAFVLSGTLAQGQSFNVAPLSESLHKTGATGVLVDIATGAVLASYGSVDGMASPGSTLKPFILKMALENGIIGERDGVHCSGTLMISGHNLACGHPRDITVLDARMALANSCNTYFATIARRTGAESLGDGLRAYGLKLTGKLDTPEERELLVLGIAGVHVSPMQIAAAYRRLAQQMNAESSAAIVARDGMVQSVETGMARSAHVDGVALAGKTGTAQEVGVTWSHGWFAGIVLDGKRQAQKVIVIYVPNGNGNDAAMLARRVLMREAGR